MEIKGRDKTIIIKEGKVTDIGDAVDEYAELKGEMNSGLWSTGVWNMMNDRCLLVQQFILNYILNTRKAFLVWASRQERKVKKIESEVK